jgi:ribosomal protein L37AE/L43A
MARCEGCGLRFRYPGRREKYPEALKWAGPVATPFSSAEEKEAPKMAEENTQPKVAKELTAADSSERGSRGCPACGSTAYHRTKRTKLEHLRLRPPMARCEKCGTRFPYPAHRREYPEPLKFVGAAATVPRAAEEKRTPGMAEEDSGPKVTQQVIVVNYSDHGSRCCPACGSTEYHHSRRTTLDRVLLRPAMARCEKCGSRFPYSSHDNKPSDALKSGEVAANVSPVGEEGRASRTAEESSAPEVDKQGTAADSSNGGLSRCPFCGSTAYRRSRRTKLEHLLLRPKMARCRDCRKRFPYPMR